MGGFLGADNDSATLSKNGSRTGIKFPFENTIVFDGFPNSSKI